MDRELGIDRYRIHPSNRAQCLDHLVNCSLANRHLVRNERQAVDRIAYTYMYMNEGYKFIYRSPRARPRRHRLRS